MLPILIAIVVAAIGLLWWLSQSKNENGNYKPIPGPTPLPVLGNVHQVGQAMHIPFTKWAKKYGDIFKIQLGNRTVIVISNPQWLKELFSMDFMTGRQFFEGFELYPNEPLGITSIEGDMWHVHRNFLIRNLRDFGFGKSTMEDRIIEEVKEIIERLKATEGKPITNIKEIVLIAVVNSLWLITGSKRFNQDDKFLIEFQKKTNEFIDKVTKYAITLFIPWLRFLMPKLDMNKQREIAEGFYFGIIKEHEDTLQEDSPRDFIDQYLIEMKLNKNNPQSHFYGEKARRQLLVVVGDIMFAGTDSTSNTLQWSMLILSTFENIQAKFQEEITKITGDSRLVSIADRANMPYTQALMDELLRFTSLAPTGVQRRAKCGKEFKGYFIPEDTWVFPNLHYIHHNPEIWGDPENFRPERFLSNDLKTYQKNGNLMPFSTGSRSCLGQPMALQTIFLFLTNIYQRFSTCLDPSKPKPSLNPEPSIFLSPPDFHVIMNDRLTDK